MIPVRKTKDFSIKSILADTFMFIQNDRYETSFRPNVFTDNYEAVATGDCRTGLEKRSRVNMGDEGDRITRMKKHLECTVEKPIITKGPCVITHLNKNDDCSERENCAVNLKKNSEINGGDKCGTSLIQYPEDESYENTLNVKKFERDKYGYKLTSDIDEKCTVDSGPNSGSTSEEKDTKSYEDVASATKFDSTVEEEHKMNSQLKLQVGENRETATENIKIIDQQKQGFVRHFKKDRRRMIVEEQLKQLTKTQTGVLNDSEIVQLSGNYTDKSSENRNKISEEILNGKLEDTESTCPLSGSESEKLIECSVYEAGNLEVTKKLEWLQFTRYKPPKIPRKPKAGKRKRQPSRHPRIPFSTCQLDFLEQKFQNNAYLSRNDVLDISVSLKLPANRVKIWFQNRRARERRELYTKKQ